MATFDFCFCSKRAYCPADSMQKKLGSKLFDHADEQHVPESEPDFFDQHRSHTGNDLSLALDKVRASGGL